MFKNKEEKEDFFEKTPEIVEKPKEPKKPVFQPDDPRYYDEDESEWEHLKPTPYRRRRLVIYSATLLIIVGFLVWGYVYFFTPSVRDAETYGYVENIEERGMVFTSYEGVLLPYRSVMDTARFYKGDFVFSVKDAHIAATLKKQQRTGRPVKVEYVKYRTRFPWRGDEKTIVIGVDTVDPKVLLPPDRTPEYIRED